MATTDNVLKAVQDLTKTYKALQNLTKTYEALQNEVNGLKDYVPLYSDGVCYWDGCENLKVDSKLYADIMAYGSVEAKALYGFWNNAFTITLPQGTAFANPKEGMPDRCFVIRMKLNDTKYNKKAIFFKQAIADNQAHGYVSAYLVNKNTLIPYKFLGTDTGDKGSGEGRSIRYDMFNGGNLPMRYHSWLSYNFDLDSAKNAIDENGYVYIGFTSTVATYYVSGWGIANRNTDFIWQNAYVMTYGSLPMSAVPVASSTNSGGLYLSYFARDTLYSAFEVPYEDTIKTDVILSFIDGTSGALYTGNMVLQGTKTGTIFRQNKTRIGNFGRLLCNGGESTGVNIISYIIPRHEVKGNTVIRNGKNYLVFDIPKFLSERSFLISGLYTEEYKGI